LSHNNGGWVLKMFEVHQTDSAPIETQLCQAFDNA